MQQIIDNISYNTDIDTLIAVRDDMYSNCLLDGYNWKEYLYKTSDKNFYILGTGGEKSRFHNNKVIIPIKTDYIMIDNNYCEAIELTGDEEDHAIIHSFTRL